MNSDFFERFSPGGSQAGDLMGLSRELERCDERLRRFDAALAAGARPADPFLGAEFPGKAHFDEVRELDPDDALRAPLLRWIHYLLDRRIQRRAEEHEGFLLRMDVHGVDEPAQQQISLAQMRRGALAAHGRGEQRLARAWWKAFDGQGRALGEHRQVIWSRRREVVERLGAVEAGPAAVFARPELPNAELVERVFAASDAAAEEWASPGWSEFVHASCALDSAELWPARLSLDVLRDLLGGGQLFRGVRLTLEQSVSRLTPSSYLLAAHHLGVATAREHAPRDLPFVVAHHPSRLAGVRLGLLFAAWMTSPPFARRRLGALGQQAELHHRATTRSLVLALRASALRSWLAQSLWGPQSIDQVCEAGSERLFRQGAQPATLVARLQVDWWAPLRLRAQVAALGHLNWLREQFDDDWYDNPRAQEYLRAEQNRPDAGDVSGNEIREGLLELERWCR